MKHLITIWFSVLFFGAQAQISNSDLRGFILEKDFIDEKFTINVADRVTGKPIEGLPVKIYQGNKYEQIVESRKNGDCLFNLARGTYGIMINDENYMFFMDSITVGNDKVNHESIYLYPKKGVRLVPVEGAKLE